MARRRRKDDRQDQTITRKEYLRQRKDRQERQTLIAVLGPVLIGVVLFLGYGIYTELIRGPRQPVARVEGTNITTAQFQKRIQYDRRQFITTLASFAQYASTTDPSVLQQLFGSQRANLPDTTLNQMIDDLLVQQEAAARGIEVTDDDVQDRIGTDLATMVAPRVSDDDLSTAEASGAATDEAGAGAESGDDTGVESESGAETVTDAEGVAEEGADVAEDAEPDADGDADTDTDKDTEPAADAEDVDATDAITETAGAPLERAELEEAFRDFVQPVLDQTGISRGDYNEIVRGQIYREKLNEALGAELPVTATQVEAGYLLFTSQATADEAAAALADGATWAQVVDRYAKPEDAEGEVAEPAAEEAAESLDAADEAEDATLAGEESGAEAPEDAEADGPDQAADQDVAEDEVEVDAEEAEDTTGAESEAADESESAEMTDADVVGDTEAITDTASITPTIAVPTPAPTPTPEPFASEIGEREWYTHDRLQQELQFTNATDADTVFELAAGETSDAIAGQGGTYLVHVFEVDEERPLEQEELDQLKEGALTEWLNTRREEAQIDRFADAAEVAPPEPLWFTDSYERYAGSPQPTIDLSSLSQPEVTTGEGATSPDEGEAAADEAAVDESGAGESAAEESP